MKQSFDRDSSFKNTGEEFFFSWNLLAFYGTLRFITLFKKILGKISEYASPFIVALKPVQTLALRMISFRTSVHVRFIYM